MLIANDITTGYGKKLVVKNVSFSMSKGEFLLLSGGNGSGKSTILKAIYGILPLWKSEDEKYGSIIFNGQSIVGTKPSEMLKKGIVYMPQKKNVFENFTVDENLSVAANIYDRQDCKRRIGFVYDTFPILKRFQKRIPFSMSGGERQILAFGCALLHNPTLMLLDEPFAGVDNINTEVIQNEISRLHKSGTSFITVEHKKFALESIPYREIKLELGTIKYNV